MTSSESARVVFSFGLIKTDLWKSLREPEVRSFKATIVNMESSELSEVKLMESIPELLTSRVKLPLFWRAATEV